MLIPTDETTIAPPTLHWKAEFDVVGMVYHGKEPAGMQQIWQQFMPRAQEVNNQVPHTDRYGISHHYDEATGEWDYMAGIEVAGPGNLPDGMVRWHIPSGTYAIFECTLPMIGRTNEYILNNWLPESEFKRTSGPDYELYDEHFDITDPASKLYIYLPVYK